MTTECCKEPNVKSPSKMATRCECTAHGFCKRHGCFKFESMYKLCQTRSDYFELWEQGRGPGQGIDRIEPQPKGFGLGDGLAWVLGQLGIRPWKGCGCDKRKAWLNRIRLWPIRLWKV